MLDIFSETEFISSFNALINLSVPDIIFSNLNFSSLKRLSEISIDKFMLLFSNSLLILSLLEEKILLKKKFLENL